MVHVMTQTLESWDQMVHPLSFAGCRVRPSRYSLSPLLSQKKRGGSILQENFRVVVVSNLFEGLEIPYNLKFRLK